jgi:hypothetical protein
VVAGRWQEIRTRRPSLFTEDVLVILSDGLRYSG